MAGTPRKRVFPMFRRSDAKECEDEEEEAHNDGGSSAGDNSQRWRGRNLTTGEPRRRRRWKGSLTPVTEETGAEVDDMVLFAVDEEEKNREGDEDEEHNADGEEDKSCEGDDDEEHLAEATGATEAAS